MDVVGRAVGAVPPGWHPDPARRALLRFWDGAAWTDWVSDGGPARALPLSDEPVPARGAQGDDREATRGAYDGQAPARSAPGLAATHDQADERARFVVETLVPEAVRRGYILAAQGDSLAWLADELAPSQAGPIGGAAGARTGGPAVGAWAVPAGASSSAGSRAGSVPVPTGAGVDSAVRAAPVATPMAADRTAGVGVAVGVTADAPNAAQGWWSGPVAPRARPAREPSAAARWWRAMVERLGSEMAVHGLTYLGVLLLFVGLFGLVAFAFGDVAPAVRPVAEVVSVLVPFVAARVLLRQGAVVVGRAMEGLGALLLPLMLVTSLVDGFGADATGPAAPVVLTGACLLAAAAQLAWTRRQPASGVRYAVAPTLWLAAGMATIAVGRPMPHGQDVAAPTGVQSVALAWAVALTALIARRVAGLAPPGPAALAGTAGASSSGSAVRGGVADAAAAAVLPGSIVVLALGLATAAADGWAAFVLVPVLLACAVAWDRSVPRLPGAAADVLVTLAVLLAALRLLVGPPDATAPRVAVLVGTVVLLVAVADLVGGRRRSELAPVLAQVGVGLGAAGAVLTLATDGDLVGRAIWAGSAAAGVAGWALWRRRSRPGAGLDAVAVGAQGLLVLAVGAAHGRWAALLAGAVLAVAVGSAARASGERFWVLWWQALAALVGLGLLSGAMAVLDEAPDRAALLAVALMVFGAALLTGPLATGVRVAGVTAVGWGAWLAGAAALDLPWGWRVAVVALGGLALGAVAHLARPATPLGPWLGVMAHLSVLLSLGLDGAAVLAWAALTGLWALTGLGVDRDTGPWRRLAGDLGRAAGPVAWSVALLAAPVTAVLALDQFGILTWDDTWRGESLLLIAVGYLLATRVEVPRGAEPVVVPLAVLLAAVAAAVSGSLAALAVALGVLVVVPLLPQRTPAWTVWSAWAFVPPLGWVAVGAVGPAGWWDTGLELAALIGLVLGGGAAIGALLVDEPRPTRRTLPLDGGRSHEFDDPTGPPAAPASPPSGPVVPAAERDLQRGGWGAGRTAALVTGLVHVVLAGLATAVLLLDLTHPRAAGLVGIGAAVVLSLGVLAALPPVIALGVILAWIGVQLALGELLGPWLQLGLVALLLLAAHLLSRRPRRGWARADSWTALAGVPAYLVGLGAGLVRAALDDEPPLLVVVAGVLLVAVAVRLRRRRPLAEVMGWAGTLVLLAGSSLAGLGWLALTLLATAAAHTVLAATVEHGTARSVRRWVGSVFGLLAWRAALSWWNPAAESGVAASVGLAAAVLVVLAVLDRTVRPSRSWVLAWGSSAGLLGVVALGSVAVGGARPTLAQAVGVLVAAVALALLAPWGLSAAAVLVLVAAELVLGALSVSHATTTTVLLVASAVAAVAEVAARPPLPVSTPGRATVLGVETVSGPTTVPGGATMRGAEKTRGPATVLAVGLMVLGATHATLAAGKTPAGMLAAGVLVAAAVQAVAAGVAWRQLGLRLAAPILAWSAWAALVVAGVGGSGPVWFTAPLGVALLVVVALWRADLRGRGLPVAPSPLPATELAGIALMVAASFAAAFTDGVQHALFAALVGAAVGVWGLLSRVRRRLFSGAVIVVAALVVAVALPLVAVLPAWGGAGVWILVAVVGLLVVGAATLVEKGRLAARAARSRVGEWTAGWE